MLSKTTEYALRAVLALGRCADDQYTRVPDLAQAAALPAPFLSKLLQQLVHRGLLFSRRGTRGGVRLARPARDIRAFEVIEAVEGAGFLSACRVDGCDPAAPCRLRRAELAYIEALRQTPLADLAA